MIENKDGVSFTATWGRTGSQGRTKIYDMSEWDKIHRSKINKGYKSQHHNNPTNWIQGMSVAQRKKQGITTVQPFFQPKKAKKKPKAAIKKTAKKQGITTVMPGDKGFGKVLDKDGSVHYDVGQVDVKVNKSHMNKLRVLHMTMNNWEKNNGKVPMDSRMGRMYEADLHKVEELVEEGREILTKEEMLDMNVLFKTYGGKRKNPNPW